MVRTGEQRAGHISITQRQTRVRTDVGGGVELAFNIADDQRETAQVHAGFAFLWKFIGLSCFNPFAHDDRQNSKMVYMPAKDEQFSRYHAMLSPLASRALADADAPGAANHMAIALPAARLLLSDDPSQYEPLVTAMRTLASARSLTDWAGHHRPCYHPFAVHLCLAAFHRHYENIPPSVWSRCEEIIPALVEPLRGSEHFADAAPPDEFVPLVLWQALGLAEQATLLSRDVDLEMTDSLVAVIVANPALNGALHGTSPEESLDSWTYSELVGLHALARLALLRRHKTWAKRVEEIAMYHLENTQPDNATNQPWGLFAFLWSAKTRSFAEQQMHDATAHSGGAVSPLAAMLLADAADCLAEFG